MNDNSWAVNPFIYEGEIIAVNATFAQMVAADEAVFRTTGTTDTRYVKASNVPGALFTREAEVLLAGRVLGNVGMDTGQGGQMLVPHLEFVGAVSPAARTSCLNRAGQVAVLEKQAQVPKLQEHLAPG